MPARSPAFFKTPQQKAAKAAGKERRVVGAIEKKAAKTKARLERAELKQAVAERKLAQARMGFAFRKQRENFWNSRLSARTARTEGIRQVHAGLEAEAGKAKAYFAKEGEASRLQTDPKGLGRKKTTLQARLEYEKARAERSLAQQRRTVFFKDRRVKFAERKVEKANERIANAPALQAALEKEHSLRIAQAATGQNAAAARPALRNTNQTRNQSRIVARRAVARIALRGAKAAGNGLRITAKAAASAAGRAAKAGIAFAKRQDIRERGGRIAVTATGRLASLGKKTGIAAQKAIDLARRKTQAGRELVKGRIKGMKGRIAEKTAGRIRDTSEKAIAAAKKVAEPAENAGEKMSQRKQKRMLKAEAKSLDRLKKNVSGKIDEMSMRYEGFLGEKNIRQFKQLGTLLENMESTEEIQALGSEILQVEADFRRGRPGKGTARIQAVFSRLSGNEQARS